MKIYAEQIKKGIGSAGLFTFTYCSTIPIGTVFLPYVSAAEIRSAWLKVVVAVIPYFLFIYLLKKTTDKHGTRDVFQLLKSMAPSWIYYIVLVYFFCSALYTCLFGTKSLVIIVQTYLMQATEQHVIMLTYLAIAGISVFYGIKAISRMIIVMFLHDIILIASLALFFFSEDFRWLFVRPVFDFQLLTFMESSISEVSRYGGVVALLAFLPYVDKNVKIINPMATSLFVIMVTYLMVSLLVLGVFGFDQAITLLSPITALMQTATSATGLFERLDLFFLTVWVMSFYKSALIFIWFTSSLLKKLIPFRIKRDWILVSVVTGMIILLSLFTPAITNMGWEPYNINNLVYTLVLPMGIFCYLLVRKNKGQGASDS
ncbi:spore germination protein (amino acid permease) [Evansella caseinilytica]|uniref:Spore germination protein (Amino acid permease) n=1 Tax=Evansella caseinilytica TaxID=1503961 RepID=A0A1H3U701_9BACI|nr:GerAB/ArcD/ProY family transporter [Evansella caseinilytica]SDZ58273.1 spore germination protein (amino acid permease) [Evansella caseinilytica]